MSLEDLLRRTANRVDPVPAAVLRHAHEAFVLSGLDQELAELTADSWLDAAAPTRGDGTRMLTFEPVTGPGPRIEVDLTRSARAVELAGQVIPPAAGRLRVIHRGGETVCPVDVRGRFGAEIPLVGSIRLAYQPDSADAPIVTQWVPIG